jgi:anti-sigma regulatory factor (Ser/Thr protein kinase)
MSGLGPDVPSVRSFRAHPSALHSVREFVRERGAQVGLRPVVVDDLLIAVSEACANALLHTNSSQVRVTWRTDGDAVAVEVRDEGIFKRHVPSADPDAVGGNGIPLMIAVMDEVTFIEGTPARPGTIVRLVRRVDLLDQAG